jgi:hypothetical protein
MSRKPVTPAKTPGKRHVKTELLANEARAYATVGTPHHDIALLMNISIKTLLKYYGEELAQAKARGVAMVAKTLYTKATQDQEPWAICFYLKCQGGWRETSVIQNQALDKHGNPVDQPKLGISFTDGGPGLPQKALVYDPDGAQKPKDEDEDAEPTLQ